MATVSLDDLLAQAARRLDDVQTHSIPSLHDVKTLADQQDRSAEARSDLALVARYIEVRKRCTPLHRGEKTLKALGG